jgi:hypothetical protein
MHTLKHFTLLAMNKLFESIGIFSAALTLSANCYAQNTGIGTASPGSTLHIKNANTDPNASPLIIEANTNYGGATYSGIEFRAHATSVGIGPSGRIKSFYQSPLYTSATMVFQTIGPGPVFVDAMTITNGNVGIGVNPSAKLDVNGNIKIADGTQGTGKVLTSNASGIASWQNLPSTNYGFKVTQSSPQSVPTTTTTTVLWPVEVYDDANAFSANAYTVPVSGLYHFDVKVNWNNVGVAGSPFTAITLRKNGVEAAFSAQNIPAGVTNVITVNISCDLKLVAGDVLTVTAQQNTGGNLGFAGGEYLIFFSGHRVY